MPFTFIMALSPDNDPLSLEYWLISHAQDRLKGTMAGVFWDLIQASVKKGKDSENGHDKHRAC
jgi:hypothetical protein